MKQRITVKQWAASGQHTELGEIFGAIARAAAEIAAKIRLAGLDEIYGAAGATNVQGEQQQKLDVFANDIMTDQLRGCSSVLGLVSEEDDEPVLFARPQGGGKKFVLSFDPLDGSSNIDVNVNVGTIFGVRVVAGGKHGPDASGAAARFGAGGGRLCCVWSLHGLRGDGRRRCCGVYAR